MSKLLLVIFSIFVFSIPIFLLLIYKKKYNRLSKTNSFSPLIPTTKEQEYNPDINTNNWDLHKNRLIKFGRSQYKGLTFFVNSEDRIYYLSEKGTKVYC
tara:strand:- start:483 stop:779 length:297 start_codon:yes stop_codon:yes gene_type:complete